MYKKRLPKSSRPYISPSETRNLHYLKNLKDTLEAHQTKASSILFRKQLLEHQNKINYTTELSRIRGELSKTNVHFLVFPPRTTYPGPQPTTTKKGQRFRLV